MGEVGPGWFKMVDGDEGFTDGHVGGVPFVTEAVDHENVEVMEKFQGSRGEGFDVGDVCEGADILVIKAESVGADATVIDLDGCDGQALEGEDGFERTGFRANVAALGGFAHEGPGIHACQSAEGFR